jgi:hypothetical protein
VAVATVGVAKEAWISSCVAMKDLTAGIMMLAPAHCMRA